MNEMLQYLLIISLFCRHLAVERAMCKHRLLLSLYIGITWTDLKITNAWIPPPRDSESVDLGCSLGTGIFKSFPGYLNVRPRLHSVFSMTFPFHEITK